MMRSSDKISYETYLDWQKLRSKKKWGKRPSLQEKFKHEFASMWEQVKDTVGKPSVIGCMGIRNGNEYIEFKKYLPQSEVYGVDIVDWVTGIGTNCFCYDFNQLPEDWKEKFDLVFSNSIDHSFEVEKTIAEWLRVTKKGGYLLIQFQTILKTTFTDRLGFSPEDMNTLFSKDLVEFIKEDFCHTEDNTFYYLFRKR